MSNQPFDDDDDTGESEGKDIYGGFNTFMADSLKKIVDNDSNSLYATVKEDEDGELYIEFPPDFLDKLGWEEGDTLSWRQSTEYSWVIRKMNDGK